MSSRLITKQALRPYPPTALRTKDLIISEYDLMHLLYYLSSYAKKQHFKFLECLKNIQIVVVDRL